MLVYNGIPMQLLKTNVIDREAVYDESGTDYLYTRWLISVICLYNPGWMMAPAVYYAKTEAVGLLKAVAPFRPRPAGDIDPREADQAPVHRLEPGQVIPADVIDQINELFKTGGFPEWFPPHLLKQVWVRDIGSADWQPGRDLKIQPDIDLDLLFQFNLFLDWIGKIGRFGPPPNQQNQGFLMPNVPGQPPQEPAPGPQGGVNNDQIGPAPYSPVETDYALRHHLMQPRRQLVLLWDSGLKINAPITEALLISPLPGYQTDALNGPKPHHCDIQRVAGEARTFIVHFTVETNLNECGEGASRSRGAPAMLSNRWTMNYDVDQDYATRQVVEGVARFRTDLLLDIGQSGALPDDFRSEFYFPIEPGFKRENIRLTASPDGAAIFYHFEDVEVARVFNAVAVGNGPTRAGAIHRLALVGDYDVLGGALAKTERHLQYKANREWIKQQQAARKQIEEGGPNVPEAIVVPLGMNEGPARGQQP